MIIPYLRGNWEISILSRNHTLQIYRCYTKQSKGWRYKSKTPKMNWNRQVLSSINMSALYKINQGKLKILGKGLLKLLNYMSGNQSHRNTLLRFYVTLSLTKLNGCLVNMNRRLKDKMLHTTKRKLRLWRQRFVKWSQTKPSLSVFVTWLCQECRTYLKPKSLAKRS